MSHVYERMYVDCMVRIPVLQVIISLPRSFTELMLEQSFKRGNFITLILEAGKPRMLSLCRPIAEQKQNTHLTTVSVLSSLSVLPCPLRHDLHLQEMGLKIPAHKANTQAY